MNKTSGFSFGFFLFQRTHWFSVGSHNFLTKLIEFLLVSSFLDQKHGIFYNWDELVVEAVAGTTACHDGMDHSPTLVEEVLRSHGGGLLRPEKAPKHELSF